MVFPRLSPATVERSSIESKFVGVTNPQSLLVNGARDRLVNQVLSLAKEHYAVGLIPILQGISGLELRAVYKDGELFAKPNQHKKQPEMVYLHRNGELVLYQLQQLSSPEDGNAS